MASADDLYIHVNVHAIIGGKCQWTRIGEFLQIPFYVASCGGSGNVGAIVASFEYCPWCGLEIHRNS